MPLPPQGRLNTYTKLTFSWDTILHHAALCFNSSTCVIVFVMFSSPSPSIQFNFHQYLDIQNRCHIRNTLMGRFKALAFLIISLLINKNNFSFLFFWVSLHVLAYCHHRFLIASIFWGSRYLIPFNLGS